jgi:hypothetical protein
MEIESLHKYIHLNKLANGTIEVLFGGQPALTISHNLGDVLSTSAPASDSYWWTINPVFAKLSYGANVHTDIPYCLSSSDSEEDAVANGLAKLHSMGAFNTEVDFPDDTYASAAAQVNEERLALAVTLTESVFDASHFLKKMAAKSVKPEFTMEEIVASIADVGTVLSKKHRKALFEHFAIGTPAAFNPVTGLPIVSTRTIVEYKEPVDTAAETHETAAETVIPVVEVQHTFSKFLTRQKQIALEAKENEYTANQALSGAKLGKPVNGPIKIKSASGSIISHHATETDAMRTFKMMKDTKGVKIQRESEDGSEIDITDQINESILESQEKYDKWVADVNAKHGDKGIKFKGRIEQGLHTTSAEISGKDRSYGVWDHDKEEGTVFESEQEVVGELIAEELTDAEVEKRDEIVTALKKTKGFVAKYGKDKAFAIATSTAKELV